jgi:hypothetical protein
MVSLFERKVLWEIYGPNNEKGIWRIKTNQELDKIIKHKNIINFIQAQRLSWLGHVERMQGTRMVKAIYCWNPMKRRPKADRKHAGWTMSEKTYKSLKYQIRRLSHKIGKDGRKSWLRRPKLYKRVVETYKKKITQPLVNRFTFQLLYRRQSLPVFISDEPV